MPDSLNIVTPEEAKDAINFSKAGKTSHDIELSKWITAVSRRIDKLCGPVVARAVSDADKLYDGGQHAIRLQVTPVYLVTSLTEYSNTTATTLTAETNTTKPTDGYLLDERSQHDVLIRRRNGNGDSTFPAGRRNIEIDYQAGRYADTDTVDAKFKMAVGAILRRLWSREAGAWAQAGDPFTEAGAGTVGFFRTVDPVVTEFLYDEMYPPTVL